MASRAGANDALARCLAVIVACVVLAGCQGDGEASGQGASDGARSGGRAERRAAAGEEDGGGSADCEARRDFQAQEADARRISDGGRVVTAVAYPLPDYEGNPWSQWGQGLVLADGRYFSAVGDHCGANGDAYVYEFSASDGKLASIGDVLSVTGHEADAWGYGKIHGAIVKGADGGLYAATYWGSARNIEYSNGYEGDVLLRIDPTTRKIESLGAPVPKHGIPSLAATPDGRLLYGEALDPTGETREAKRARSEEGDDSDVKPGQFFVYDVQKREVVFRSTASHAGYRSVMVDRQGRAYFSAGEKKLHVFDPEERKLTTHPSELPGEFLRAATAPGPDGTVYGVTRDPVRFFALRPSGAIDDLGPAAGYTASMALEPDGSHFYYVPYAHGSSWKIGTPLLRVDTKTGDAEVVIRLNPLAEKTLELRLGGSYSVSLDRTGRLAYIGLNAGKVDEKDAFGSVVLVTVEL